MSGIPFQQLRLDSNPGLEGTLTAGTSGPWRVKTGVGLTRANFTFPMTGSWTTR